MAGDDYYNDMNFNGYQVSTVDPGYMLLLGTGLACLLCFFLGFLCIPGKILHPLSKRFKEYIAWLNERFGKNDVELDDDLLVDLKHGHDSGYDEFDDNPNDDRPITNFEMSSMGGSMGQEVRVEGDWKEVMDEKTQSKYYHNKKTGKTTWVKPVVMYTPTIDYSTRKHPRPTSAGTTGTNTSTGSGTSNATGTSTGTGTTGTTNPYYKSKYPSEDTTKWNEMIDDETGMPYYFHSETQKSTWRKPLELYKIAKHKRKAKKAITKGYASAEAEASASAVAAVVKEIEKSKHDNDNSEALLEATSHDFDESSVMMNMERRRSELSRAVSESSVMSGGIGNRGPGHGDFSVTDTGSVSSTGSKRSVISMGKNKNKRAKKKKSILQVGIKPMFGGKKGSSRRANSMSKIHADDSMDLSTHDFLSLLDEVNEVEAVSVNGVNVGGRTSSLPTVMEAAVSMADSDTEYQEMSTPTATTTTESGRKLNIVPAPPIYTPARLRQENKGILKLAIPWMFQSVIADGSSIMSVMMISHFLGLKDMLVYSNVWFIIYLAFVVNDAWYNALYKHVNVSAALETTDGYTAAGRYVKIGIIGNIISAIPLSILSIIFIPQLLTAIGYHEAVAMAARPYTAVAIANNLFDTTTGIVDCVLDIEGHAKWGAAYDFWDSIINLVATFFFLMYVPCTLWMYGLFTFGLTILSSIFYFWITWKRKKWFQQYKQGLLTPIAKLHWAQIYKLIKMTGPMTTDAIIGNIEYTVFTVFAASQGTAEAATWILLSYVWSAVGIIPDSFSAAASCRLARIISNGEIKVAKMVSTQSMYIATCISIVCSILMYVFRHQFVWCLSLDETLEDMILQVIPYICLCYPFMTVGGTAMDLNDALHLYKRAMVSMALVTTFVMVPIGYVMTYIYNFNIEGLASAQCIGYTAAGVINIMFFMTADWDKAVTKAQGISGAGSPYEKYEWDELPNEVKDAAEQLGYTQGIWEEEEENNLSSYDELTETQKFAAARLGYTKDTWDSL